ncbi:hypothetical protein [Glycomyces buryatensis]|uniref:DUF8185 domain-containing protein n=1 Tax=Glycomyces buryatensis TaxID=2570927 RepID=A0A4S8Q5S0_9ACTN|nr:hypothetical protein [Glycomyces buryatensis]THV39440.1 hypothetical protein FAB82_17635 [Glycomyces buryatensis]
MDRVNLAGDDASFASRVARLDPDAPVLVKDSRLWATLPIGVLAVRDLDSALDEGVYRAAGLAQGTGEPGPEAGWRGKLPLGEWETIETIPAAEIARLDRQAGEALAERRGQGTGDRRLRDALLDHVVLRVEHDGKTHHVEFRLIAALMRMGFLGDDPVRVVRAGRRLGLAATFGTVWERERGLPLL